MEVLVLLLGAVSALANPSSNLIEVDVEQGQVWGYREKVMDVDLDIFLGIPYAKSPTGNRRFKPPQEIKKFPGARVDALTLPNACVQMSDEYFRGFEGSEMWNPNTGISEDCLYLNVWAPSEKPPTGSKSRAIMVWIYGGAFMSGTSTLELYDGRILAAKNDVIVMSMQYRVGPLGFMYLGNEEAPGNVGLLDQLLAIQWIHANAETFGGDKDRITIFGESAGASSVSLHLMSPLSKPFINNAIMQSGSALARWSINTRAKAQTDALKMAEQVQCVVTDPEPQVDIVCMRTVPPKKLFKAMFAISESGDLVTLKPVVDKHFLHEHPKDIANSGSFKSTDIMTGSNTNEGSYFLIYWFPKLFKARQGANLTEEEFAQGFANVVKNPNPVVKDVVTFEYLNPDFFVTDINYFNVLDNLLGDFLFICPALELARAYDQHGQKPYYYHFDHRTSANPWPRWAGVMHGYEIDHVFGAPLNTSKGYNDKERTLSEQMMKYWTNFAKTGDPNGESLPEWQPFTNDDKHVLHLTATDITIKQSFRDRKCRFWREYLPHIRDVLNDIGPSKPKKCSGNMDRLSEFTLVIVVLISLLYNIRSL